MMFVESIIHSWHTRSNAMAGFKRSLMDSFGFTWNDLIAFTSVSAFVPYKMLPTLHFLVQYGSISWKRFRSDYIYDRLKKIFHDQEYATFGVHKDILTLEEKDFFSSVRLTFLFSRLFMRLFNRFDVLEDKFNKDGSFNLTLTHSLNTTNITLKVPRWLWIIQVLTL